MSLVRWFTRNVADTRPPTHDDLGPLTLPGSDVAAAAATVRQAAAMLSNWAVVEVGPDSMHLTRKTRVMGYTDDVRLFLKPVPGGVQVHAESRSRVGKGDLGQNRRNILELWRALTR